MIEGNLLLSSQNGKTVIYSSASSNCTSCDAEVHFIDSQTCIKQITTYHFNAPTACAKCPNKKNQTFLILRNMSAFATSQTKRVHFGGIPLLGVEGREVCD